MASAIAQLYTHLKKDKLKPIYLLASDVTLLKNEARDAIRNTTHQSGFHSRETHYVEAGFDWNHFYSNNQNLNLFSEKTFVELNNPSAKFDDKATKGLIQYLEHPPADKILLITTNKLTSAQQKARWYKAISEKGIATSIRAITNTELPQWINQRAKHLKLTLNTHSINLLADLTQGNLLATHQALNKLQLLFNEKNITTTEILAVISDSARFNVFDLSNHTLNGKAKSALRTLHGLKDTGTEPILILWALTREIRECLNLADQRRQGNTLDQLLQRQWQSRRALLKQALNRLNVDTLTQCLKLAETTDRVIKGNLKGNAWNALETLILFFSTGKSSITARAYAS